MNNYIIFVLKCFQICLRSLPVPIVALTSGGPKLPIGLTSLVKATGNTTQRMLTTFSLAGAS